MEINVEQGDIIEFVENRMQVLVLSKNFVTVQNPSTFAYEKHNCGVPFIANMIA